MNDKILNYIRILFVGSFGKPNEKISGGQMYASTTLVNSKFNLPIEWVQLDTTASTNLARPFYQRLWLAFLRIEKFVICLISNNINIVLIFTTYGFGFIEKGMMVLLARLFGKTVILAPRSGIIIDDVQRSLFMRWFVQRVMHLSNKVICQSPEWKEFYSSLLSGNAEKKMVIIPNWFDATDYINIPLFRRENHDRPIKVLFIGWVDENKGVFDLLDAMLHLDDLDILLTIGGQGVADEVFDRRVCDLKLGDRVKRAGWVSGNDKKILFSEADIFVLPSYREGLPNALLEAMASGLPSVVSRVGGIPDVINHGESGFLINPGDSVELAKNLRLLATNKALRDKVGEHARDKVLNDHSLDKAVLRFEHMFNELSI